MKIKSTLFLLSVLFLTHLYGQSDDINSYFVKFLNAKKKDTSALNLLRTDTSFVHKYVSSNRESSATIDLFKFQYRFPENEKADSVAIEFSTYSKTEDDHHPTINYFFPADKSKDADKKFNELDGKITKVATGRTPIIDQNKKIVSYRMKQRPGDIAPSANLNMKTIEDSEGNKIIWISLSLHT